MMNVNNEICKSFNRHAHEYEQVAKVQIEIGKRMFERLNYLTIKPKRILDLGCSTGLFSRQLKKMYPKAEIVGFDIAHNMLLQAKSKQGWRCKWSLISGDMLSLPFAAGAFDLVFANQVIHWGPVKAVFRELNRVMNTHGCLMFTTLGPDTFKELKKAWSAVDQHAHSNEFADMHDLGDWLMEERFLEPVVDMEQLIVEYESMSTLLQALKKQGVRNVNPARQRGLTGKHVFHQLETHYAELLSPRGKYPLSYEVVYGHAWKGEQRKTGTGIETFIPVSQIGTRIKLDDGFPTA